MSAIELMAKKLLLKPKATDIPTILCRRNTPHVLTGPLFDKTWEGIRLVNRNGKLVKEITHSHVVKVSPEDNTCEIPDTPNNRKRLELISQPRYVKQETTRIDVVTQKEVKEVVDLYVAPNWEILEENILKDNLLDELAKRMLRMKSEDSVKFVEEDKPAVEEPEETGVSHLPRRGRPRKLQEVPKQTGKSLRPSAVVE